MNFKATFRHSVCSLLTYIFLLTSNHAIGQGLTVITTPFNVSCHGGSDGLVASLVIGGTPPYSYLWSEGSTTANISNVPAGLYSVTVTDTSGNVGQASAIVNEPAPMTLTFDVTNAIGAGGSDGAIDLTVSGGIISYTFQWSNGANTEDINGLVAGIYCVTVIDGNGCTTSGCDTVMENAAAYCPVSGQDQVLGIFRTICMGATCHNSSNDNGYGDYTFLNGRFDQGAVSPITLVPHATGMAAGPFVWKVWLDANQDKDFDDPGEMLFQHATATSDTVLGQIMIPAAALTGPTRLRVAMGNVLGGPCDNPPFGEVQDYTIIVSVPYCGDVVVSNNTSWIEEFCVNALCLNSGADAGGFRLVTTSQTLVAGNTFNFTLTPGYSGSSIPVHWKIYLDGNRDGDFEEANEELWSSSAASDSVQSGSFTIPTSFNNGRTRIRFMMSESPIFNACDAVALGEVEEFRIGITGGSNTRTRGFGEMQESVQSPKSAIRVFPNPATTVVQVHFNEKLGPNDKVVVIDMLGKTCVEIEAAGKTELTLDRNQLRDGLYFLQVIGKRTQSVRILFE